MFDIESLLEAWAQWCLSRSNEGLGYAVSSLNRLIYGDGLLSRNYAPVLPYGVDVDSICAKVDQAICQLPDVHRAVLQRHYLTVGEWQAKAKECGLAKSSYYRFLDDARMLVKNKLNAA